MTNHVMRFHSLRFGAAVMLGLTSLVAGAQTQAATPTPAQMQQEIEALRAQVQQLQQAHDMPMDKGMGMGMKPGMGMKKMPPKKPMPPAAAPMKKGCMGMGCMEKGDDAMEMPMPPADGADPTPMPHM